MNGKNRCRILKDIRKKIASENGIEYITTECKYKGDCLGTCPKCESEVRYLERELQKKRSLGQRVAIAGLAAGITLTASGCSDDIFSAFGGKQQIDGDLSGTPETSEFSENDNSVPNQSGVSEIVDGEIVEVVGEMPDTSDTMGEEPELMGEPSYEESATAGILMPEPPEIMDPYLDMMGIVASFDVDINDVARMNNKEAMQALDGWTREFIDYHWQEYIDVRDYYRTDFVVSGDSRIEVWYDGNVNVTEVYVLAAIDEEEIMGDMEPVDDYE